MQLTLSVSLTEIQSKSHGKTKTVFDVREFDTDNRKSIELLFQTRSYSSNIWRGGKCLNKNFEYMTGVILDVDMDFTIKKAQEVFKDVNYIIHTSTSHLADNAKKKGVQERFRIILPFKKEDYKLITNPGILTRVYIMLLEQYPFADHQCKDAAHKYFPFLNSSHPQLFQLHINDVGNYFTVDTSKLKLIELAEEENEPTETPSSGGGEDDPANPAKKLLHLTDIVACSDGKKHSVVDIKKHTPCTCLFHPDETASAFIEVMASGRKFLRCSACDTTAYVPLLETYNNLFYTGKKLCKVYESHTGAIAIDEMPPRYLDDLNEGEKDKLLLQLAKIGVAGDSFTMRNMVDGYGDKPSWQLKRELGLLDIIHTPVPVKIKDNQYIDNWINDMYSEYADFIRLWIAIYSYTNFRPLPMIVLVGERSIGKSTFAEFVGSIYPELQWDWSGEIEQFNPGYEQHLLIADEAQVDKKEQYKLLKKLGGVDKLLINKKYQHQYHVQNNLCFIVLTNEKTPLFLIERERPKSPANNQFFMTTINTPKVMNAHIKYELRERVGHYVRTVLRDLYEQWEKSNMSRENRYSLPTPITPLLASQYNESKTQLEYDAEEVYNACLEGYTAKDRHGNSLHTIPPYTTVSIAEIRSIMFSLNLPSKSAKELKNRMQAMGFLKSGPSINKKNRADCWDVAIPTATESEIPK